jgi:hypothetical protein
VRIARPILVVSTPIGVVGALVWMTVRTIRKERDQG